MTDGRSRWCQTRVGGPLVCGGGRGVGQGHAALKAPARFFAAKIFSFMGCLGFRVCNFLGYLLLGPGQILGFTISFILFFIK
ncbi:hypothetical protein ES332_D12G228900v1 [Gossypium tomentosum]|uniref:Uncharacterized protein n=1 Tax=Gossypium tomentosum TaxID=34277 RepID=A0A5D2IDJ5_GOSTO|nr:hypothetical protein ES332_D12G228900v1 [Gossypium tomentosum]